MRTTAPGSFARLGDGGIQSLSVCHADGAQIVEIQRLLVRRSREAGINIYSPHRVIGPALPREGRF